MRANLLFSILFPKPGAEHSQSAELMVPESGLSTCTPARVSLDQRLSAPGGMMPSVGAWQGAGCAAGSGEKPPVSPGRRPARGRRAGGAEFLPAGCLALTAGSPLRPPAPAAFECTSLPSVSPPRSSPSMPGVGHTGDKHKTVTE